MKNFFLLSSRKVALYFFLLGMILIVVPAIDLFIKIPEKEYIIILTGLWGLCLFLLERKNKLTYNYIDILTGLFIAYQLIHFFIFSQSSVLYRAMLIRVAFACLYFFLRHLYSIYKEPIFKKLSYLLFIKVLFELLLAIFQYLGFLKESKTTFFSVVGTHTSPNYFAYSLVIGLLISAWYLFYNYKNLVPFKKYMIVIFSVLNVFFLIATKSRTALIGIIICGILFLLKNNIINLSKFNLKKRITGIIVVILCLFIGGKKLYDYKKDSADGRLLVAKITLNEIKNKPIFGHGLFSFEKGYNTAKAYYFSKTKRSWNEIKVGDYILAAMNDYLQIFYETGVIGLFLLLIIFITIIYKQSNSTYSILGLQIFSFMLLAALFSSVHRHNSLVIYGIVGFLFVQHKIDFPERIIKTKLTKFLKLFFVLLSLSLITIGGLRIYAEEFVANSYKNKENISKTPLEDWEKWIKVYANNGLSEFGYGNIRYKYYKHKEEGLRIMNESLLKSITPKNVKHLAYYYLDAKKLKKAKELFELNVCTQPFRFEPKMDLLKYYHLTNQKSLFLQKAQEIIDFPVKIPSKEIEKYKQTCKSILEKHAINFEKKT